MKERVNFITDSFVDYKGVEHKFVIAAVSQGVPVKGIELDNDPCSSYADNDVFIEVNIYLEDYGTYDDYSVISKVLKLGVAICNPEDEFNEKVGQHKALARARNSDPVLFASSENPGIINSMMVEALLKQEAEYIKNNPERYIKGYKEAQEKYLQREEMLEIEENFSSLEDEVLEALREDPHYFDDVFEYYEWEKRHQETGK